MPVIRGAFVVEAPVNVTFDVTSDVSSWPEANPLVKHVEIIEREGNKTIFRMTHADGRAWNTSMFAIREQRISYSERLEPQAPLKCMQYTRMYSALSDAQTEVTEEVRFELLDESIDERVAIERMRAHMLEVQPHVKRHVEARARLAGAEGK
jgi:hypothetical protein